MGQAGQDCVLRGETCFDTESGTKSLQVTKPSKAKTKCRQDFSLGRALAYTEVLLMSGLWLQESTPDVELDILETG